MGKASLVLGMEMTRNSTITMSQHKHVPSILGRFGMEACNRVSTPILGPEISTQQRGEEPGSRADQVYQEMAGCPIYLPRCTRFDICYVVLQLSMAMSKPSKRHWTKAKHLQRYVKGKPEPALTFSLGNLQLRGFCDA